MEKTIKFRSSFLSVLNEALQKLKLNDTVKDFTPVIVEADGKFTSIVKTENDFDPSVLGANIDTEEDESENDIQKKQTREQLINAAKDAIKQTVDSSSNLKEILSKIKELSKSDDNKWQLNKEHNTASLPSRNTYIFKQNNNLCVSHKGKIELFKSVEQLREWLKNNNYPLPDDSIVIHESVDIKEHTKGDAGNSNYFGKHGNNGRNWVDLLNTHNIDKLDSNRQNFDKINNMSQRKLDLYQDLLNRHDKNDYEISKIKSKLDTLEKSELSHNKINRIQNIQKSAEEELSDIENELNSTLPQRKNDLKNYLLQAFDEIHNHNNTVLPAVDRSWGYFNDLNKRKEDLNNRKDVLIKKIAMANKLNNLENDIHTKNLNANDEYMRNKEKLDKLLAIDNLHRNKIDKANEVLKLNKEQQFDNNSIFNKGLSKRIDKDVLQADQHKKEEPKISDKYLNFDDEDNMEECFGGITGVSNLGSFVQHVANKVKSKKSKKEGIKEALEELKEAFELEEKNFPTFVPEKWRAEKNKDQIEFPCAGKAVEKVISAIQDHPEYIEDVKNGTVQLPFEKDEFWGALQAMYYDYKSTQHENSDLNALAKNFFFKKAKEFLEKYNANEEIPLGVKDKIDEYVNQGVSLTDIAVPLSGDLYQIFVMNNLLEGDDATQWQPVNEDIANEFNAVIKDVYKVDSHFKPGDVLYYITDEERTDTGDILRKRNKFADIADIGSKREFAKVAFDGFLNKKNKNGISKRDVFKMLYDALHNPNYKPSFDNNKDDRIADWFNKRRSNTTNPKDYSNFSILTDDEINQIKSNWEQKKAEIQQEEPMSEPAPQEVKAEVQQDNELSDNEKKVLNMLMTMNPNLDISKLTIAQLKERINKAMALFGESKQESIYESAIKHPWLKKIMGQRLVEDDSPADFATGSPISSDMDSSSVDTSTTSDTSSATPDIDFGGDTAAPAAPSGFGDVDISVNGYDPEAKDDESNMPASSAPEYKIIDVLANQDDPTDIRVKLQNTETGEIEVKELSEM